MFQMSRTGQWQLYATVRRRDTENMQRTYRKRLFRGLASLLGPAERHGRIPFGRGFLRELLRERVLSEELFADAVDMNSGIIDNDFVLIHGRSRFMSRLRHEYTNDSHLEGDHHLVSHLCMPYGAGFCLFGVAVAAFIKGWVASFR